jgi:proteasome assembly chaperone (PAC2) family protein
MARPRSTLSAIPPLDNATLVLAFSGWMDGGDVSTGTVNRLVEQLGASPAAQIDDEGFYILSFPGAMEITALFRPRIEIRDGLVRSLDMPTNIFYAAPEQNLLLFTGKEPNTNWGRFADLLLEAVRLANVTRLIFIGSFGGSVPHTREPRLYGTVSHHTLKPVLKKYGIRPSTYDGPASFASYLMAVAAKRKLPMISLVAEIPSYVEGANPPSIAAVARRLSAILGIQVTLAELRGESDEWETRVTAAVAKDADLAQQIRKLEEEYDDDLIQKERS